MIGGSVIGGFGDQVICRQVSNRTIANNLITHLFITDPQATSPLTRDEQIEICVFKIEALAKMKVGEGSFKHIDAAS